MNLQVPMFRIIIVFPLYMIHNLFPFTSLSRIFHFINFLCFRSWNQRKWFFYNLQVLFKLYNDIRSTIQWTCRLPCIVIRAIIVHKILNHFSFSSVFKDLLNLINFLCFKSWNQWKWFSNALHVLFKLSYIFKYPKRHPMNLQVPMYYHQGYHSFSTSQDNQSFSFPFFFKDLFHS